MNFKKIAIWPLLIIVYIVILVLIQSLLAAVVEIGLYSIGIDVKNQASIIGGLMFFPALAAVIIIHKKATKKWFSKFL